MSSPEGRHDEQALVRRAKSDPEAFGALFDRYYQQILAYTFRRIANWTDAQDITANVFLKARAGLWRYRWTGVPFSAWLYRIATNEIGMHVRRSRRAPVSYEELLTLGGHEPVAQQQLLAERRAAEIALEREARFAAARAAIATLPVKYQHVIALRFFEEKSIGEIAQILRRKEGTVKSLLSRGLARLRKLLGERNL